MFFKTRTAIFRTRIKRIARMSPQGSAACISCLMFNLHSVDSFDSCSLKHELLFFRTRIIRIARMSPVGSTACVSCLRLIYIRLIRSITSRWSVGLRQISCSFKIQVISGLSQATRTRGPKKSVSSVLSVWDKTQAISPQTISSPFYS